MFPRSQKFMYMYMESKCLLMSLRLIYMSFFQSYNYVHFNYPKGSMILENKIYSILFYSILFYSILFYSIQMKYL